MFGEEAEHGRFFMGFTDVVTLYGSSSLRFIHYNIRAIAIV